MGKIERDRVTDPRLLADPRWGADPLTLGDDTDLATFTAAALSHPDGVLLYGPPRPFSRTWLANLGRRLIRHEPLMVPRAYVATNSATDASGDEVTVRWRRDGTFTIDEP